MKFNPIRFREDASKFFGKRGISWAGAGIVFHPDTTIPWELDSREHLGRVLYVHDIIEQDTQQDTMTALSVMEALLRMLKTVHHALTLDWLLFAAYCGADGSRHPGGNHPI